MDLEPWDPLDHPARIEVRRQESDDSDAEGGLGNVTRVVLRPPGHSGKAKRGHLCFDASYESGNLGRVDFISEFEYDLFIRPDTCNPRYRLWFNFVVDNVRTDQRVVFNIVNLCKVKTLFRDGMTPLVKTSSRPKWQRLPGKYVYYHKSPEHRNHYILSFAFAFDREEDVYQFAFSFPFSYSRCQAHLELVEQKEYPYFKRENVCFSLQNRRVDVITITNTTGVNITPGKKPKLVVIIARSHPGESPTSFIAQGLTDFLTSSHAMMGALRDHVIIKIIPMMNPDGVFLGNYRCSLMGYDLNRHWNQVSPWSHPTLHAIKNFLLELDASKTMDLDMVIDMHAHSSLMGAFIYGSSYDDVYRFERHILFPKLLAHNAEDFSVSHTMYNRDASKGGSARRHLCEILKSSVNVYTMEVSFLGYTQAVTNNLVTYNEDGYFRLGRNIARTLFEYYRVTGIIPANILTLAAANAPAQEDKRGNRKSRSRSRSQPRTIKNAKSKGAAPIKKPALNPERKESLKVGPAEGGEAKRKNSRRSVSQEKAVVQLTQLTLERGADSSDASGEDSDHDEALEPNKQRYEQNKSQRQTTTTTASMGAGAQAQLESGPDIGNGIKGPKGGGVSRTDSKESTTTSASPTRGDGRQKRKSVEVRNQLRARTAAYKTFDFSQLRNAQHGLFTKSSPRHRRHIGGKRQGVPLGRKIGGGGVIGKKFLSSHRATASLAKDWHSEPETGPPCLTIIDFNMFIRKGLNHMAGKDGAWRGQKQASSRRLLSSTGVAAAAAPHNAGGNDKVGLMTTLPLLSSVIVDGIGTKVELSRRRRSSDNNRERGKSRRTSYYHHQRRREAMLMRGAVTDCSPWEETADDESSDSCCSVTPGQKEEKQRQLEEAPPQSDTLGPLVSTAS